MPASNTNNKMHQLLVIEDNRADREMIRIFLDETRLKYNLHTSDSLLEGLQIIEDHPIDLVLLDLSLSDSSGFNTLRHYLREAGQVPVVVMTGLDNAKVGLEAVRAGAQDYLIKGDFDAKRLVTAIRHSMERFRQQAAINDEKETLIEEKENLEAIKEMVVIGDWVLDIVNNSMTWSKEVFRIFDLQPNSFSPTLSDYLDFVHREDKDELREFFSEAVNEEESGPIEHRILLNNRILKVLSLRTRMKFDEKSNRILLQGIVQDVTQRQDEPDEEPSDPETAEEQESVSSSPHQHILHQIGFNIRTPLSTVINLIYLLEQTSLSKQQNQLITDLKVAVDDLSFTLSSLVNLSLLSSEGDRLSNESFRPFEVLESVKRLLLFKAEQKQRHIDMQVDPGLTLSVRGDSNKLSQVFFCLIELAFLYSNEDSYVHLNCKLMNGSKENCQMKVNLAYQGRLPEWPSEDEISSSDETLQWISKAHSAGEQNQLLGLVFLRLCQQLGIQYDQGVGEQQTLLSLHIPLEQLQMEEPDIPNEPERKVSILLVEDHPMHQIATKQVLTTWSQYVKVAVAGNGKESLSKVKQDDFDLVLMDLQMPVMDGMTAASSIRQLSTVPIIALTAMTSKQEEQRCYEIGINDYLAKPFQPEDLYKRIMKQLYRRN